MKLATLMPGVLLLALAGCRGGEPTTESGDLKPDAASQQAAAVKFQAFFIKWLTEHGEQNVVSDEQGVGLAGSTTRLTASLYGVNESPGGGAVVEVECRIRLPGGQEIVEYLAGMGKTQDEAINDALVNFVLTTFHVVYKAFMNPADPHQTLKQLTIGGQEREVVLGDLLQRGSAAAEAIDFSAMRPGIEQALANLTLSPEPHWLKLVYGQTDGAPTIVSVTLDNAEDPALTAAIRQLDWPPQREFYMVKQFIVVK